MDRIIINNDYIMSKLTINNHKEIKQLYDLCSDYSMMFNGRDANDEDVNKIFVYNDKKTEENSITLGIYNQNVLLGMIDIFKNYPSDKVWTIGLLMLSPDERNKGIGKIVHNKLVEYGINNYCDTFRIGVMNQNTKARRFWKSIGYEYVYTNTMEVEEKSHYIDIFTLNLIK